MAVATKSDKTYLSLDSDSTARLQTSRKWDLLSYISVASQSNKIGGLDLEPKELAGGK